jgi:hypothetical protein
MGEVIEWENRRELLSALHFRISEMINLKNPNKVKKQFDLIKHKNIKEKAAKL